MNKENIEALLTSNYNFPQDDYRDSVVEILTPPAWYHPIRRYRFFQSFRRRLAFVMAEYAGDLVNALVTQTPDTNQGTYQPSDLGGVTATAPSTGGAAISPKYKITGPNQ